MRSVQAYPDAKVLLTVRDDADKWFSSTRGTVGSYQHWLQLNLLSWEDLKFRLLPRMQWYTIWANPRVLAWQGEQR